MNREDIKTGMWVRITGYNEGMPGGVIENAEDFQLDQIVKVKRYNPNDYFEFYKPEFWIHNYFLHHSQFVVIRDEKGRFIKGAKLPPKKKAVVDYRQELKRRVDDNPGVCSWAIKFDNGNAKYFVREVCHASLRISMTNKPVEICLSFDYKITKEEKNLYIPYMTWMANESPLSKLFITKSGEEMFKKGCLIDPNNPTELVYSVAVITRRFFEYIHSRRTFKYLMENTNATYNDVFWLMGMLHVRGENIILNNDGHNYLTGYSVDITDLKKRYNTWVLPDIWERPKYTENYKEYRYPGVSENFQIKKGTSLSSGLSIIDNKRFKCKNVGFGEVYLYTESLQEIINYLRGE